ncbi:hypothetical protein FHS31_002959 [Sphingomonas vulcanisoli]|uniref:PilZ domain-containing protein n=1 Tax=Sphingomonas vulcanisoli TaxID=1658060 RepID=A0ABX0TXX7_9SPHN|nr:PilZ domain-containing protein [Sphingomonas vulcanisoli]NIJ09327.1 hypothetical protein [Sphingomonas vulcanisoli]
MDHPARNAKRQKIFEPFVICGPKGERRAHLLDISETGALIHSEPSCDRGALVRLSIQDTTVAAQVAWSSPPRFGVTFSQRHSADTVKAFLRA